MVRAAIQRKHSREQEQEQEHIKTSKKSNKSTLCYTMIILSILLLLFSIVTPILLLIIIESHRVENNNELFFDNLKSNIDTKLSKLRSKSTDDAQPLKKENELEDVDSKNEQEVKYFKTLSPDKTPSLNGAQKGHINCDVDVDFLSYWNDPQGDADRNFKSPFSTRRRQKTYYITFEPDRGAWNNIRMSMECMFILALVTGRTLVLPPPKPLYLMKDKNKRNHGFADFYPLDGRNGLFDHVPVISMEQFIEREGSGGDLVVKEEMKEKVVLASKECENIKKSNKFCDIVFDHLIKVGHNLEITQDTCFIFDKDIYEGKEISPFNLKKVDEFCKNGSKQRKIIYLTKEQQEHQLWHFQTFHKEYRLLIHYYNLIYFTDPAINNYVKRFVRDYLHYKDEIYCAAGKIIRSIPTMTSPIPITQEGNAEFKKKHIKLGTTRTIHNNYPGFSTMHARRGDFQYKKSKVSGEEWYRQTSDLWLPNEILYIATDERNKTFFNKPFEKHHNIYYLDDFWDVANLDTVDSAYFGMIDTIVASFGRVFVGTYFSTFTGFINRMRGYYGISMKSSYYVPEDRKYAVHKWEHVVTYAKESPEGWVRIDGDEFVDESDF